MKNKMMILVIGVMLVVVSFFCFKYLAKARYMEAEGVIVDVDTSASSIEVKTFRGYYILNIDNVEQYVIDEKVTVVFDLGIIETSKDDKVIKVYK